MRGLTAGNGPFLFGVLEKGISLAQLEAYLENAGPVSPDETAKAEISTRGQRIRTLGTLQPQGDGTVASLHFDNVSMKGLKFSEENSGWSHWIYNLGKVADTGATWTCAFQAFCEFNPSG